MDRLDRWDMRLMECVQAAQTKPFEWGSHDCVTFAADCVRAMTGCDPLKGVEPWGDAKGALRAIQARGGLSDAITSLFGEPIPPAMARRGDVGMTDGDVTGFGLLVCCGDVWVGPGLDGLQRLPLDVVRQAWRVA